MIIHSFKTYGGKHCETTAVNHVLRYYGIELSEDLLLGLGGGIGFIYWYMKQMSAPLVGGRSGGRDFNLIDNIVRRIGGTTDILSTSSATKALGWLMEDLENGRPLICYGDMAYLPYLGMSEDEHFGGHVYVVYGVDEEKDQVWIADRSANPFVVGLDDLAKSRGSKFPPFPPHHMTIRVHAPDVCDDLKPGILQAIKDCARGLEEAPISNAGLRGIEKWAKQVLVWPKQFPGRSFLDCLTSVFLYIEIGGSGGSAFRKMYSSFLREASDITGLGALNGAADAYRRSAEIWREIAVSALPDRIPSLKRCRRLIEGRNDTMEQNGEMTATKAERLSGEIETAAEVAASDLTDDDKARLMGQLNRKILELHAAEVEAHRVLSKAVS